MTAELLKGKQKVVSGRCYLENNQLWGEKEALHRVVGIA